MELGRLEKGELRVLPLLPLREEVIFPHAATSLEISRPKSIAAICAAFASPSRELLLLAQHNDAAEPGERDLFSVGTIALLEQLERRSDGHVRVALQGRRRARLVRLLPSERSLEAELEELESSRDLVRRTKAVFLRFVEVGGKAPADLVQKLHAIEDPGWLADILVPPLGLPLKERQRLLELLDPAARLEYIYLALLVEIEQLEVRRKR